MGIDACIDFKLREGAELPRLQLPQGAEVVEAFDWSHDDATHTIRSAWRLYANDYPRGHWPDISSTLMCLMAHPDIEAIWYYGDSEEKPADPFTLEQLLELTTLYVQSNRSGKVWW